MTIQNSMQNNETDKNYKSKISERSDFALRVQFKNSLPELIYDTKSIPCTMSIQEASSFKQTSLEREYNYELNFEDDVFSNVDLVNIDLYKITKTSNDSLNNTDLLLLKDENPLEKIQNSNKKTDVSWLRRSDLGRPGTNTRKSTSLNERTIELDPEMNLFKHKYKSREEQIEIINKTFQDAKSEIKTHYRDPNLKPVENYYVYPDEKFWMHSLSLVTFDTPPSIPGQTELLPKHRVAASLIKGMFDKNGEYTGYFCKDQNYNYQNIPDTVFYSMIREYNCTIKNVSHGTFDDNYIWRFDETAKSVYFTEVSAKLMMTKRRLAGNKIQSKFSYKLLILKKRDEKPEDIEKQKNKLKQIMPKTNEAETTNLFLPSTNTTQNFSLDSIF